MNNPDLDFLIEIHTEDGFLGGEIRVRLGNPDLDFENLNPDFPIERESKSKSGFSSRTHPEIKGRPLLHRWRQFGPTKKITLPSPPNVFSTISIPRIYF